MHHKSQYSPKKTLGLLASNRLIPCSGQNGLIFILHFGVTLTKNWNHQIAIFSTSWYGSFTFMMICNFNGISYKRCFFLSRCPWLGAKSSCGKSRIFQLGVVQLSPPNSRIHRVSSTTNGHPRRATTFDVSPGAFIGMNLYAACLSHVLWHRQSMTASRKLFHQNENNRVPSSSSKGPEHVRIPTEINTWKSLLQIFCSLENKTWLG